MKLLAGAIEKTVLAAKKSSCGNFAPSDKLPTGKDGAMLRIPFASRNVIEFLVGAIKKSTLAVLFFIGAPAGTRIPDTLMKSQVLYQLSYRGVQIVLVYNITFRLICQ